MSISAPINWNWPKDVARHILDDVGSTNSYAAALGAQTNKPAWVMARTQSAGRARRARSWHSPEGNFYGSLVFQPHCPAGQAALRSFVAALALFDACVHVTDAPAAFSLKWPNDVLCNGKKLAGILLETRGQGPHISQLVVGVGVNLLSAPPPGQLEPRAVPPASLWQELGVRITPERFLDHLAPAFAYWEHIFTANGFAPVRAVFLARAARLGQVIVARTQNAEYKGRFETISPDGALVLRLEDGEKTISAADVFL